MIKAVIFDCFGVMQLGAHRALEERFPEKAFLLSELTKQSDYGFLSKQEYITDVSELTGLSDTEVVKTIVKKYYFNEPLANFIKQELKPGYKIGMLSNVGRGWLQNFFHENQLDDVFDEVVISGDEGVTKPHPQIFELIAEKMHLTVEECLMVDDLPENIAGADAAGMKGIVYGNFYNFQKDIQRYTHYSEKI